MGIVELMIEQKKTEGIEEGEKKGMEKVGAAMLREGEPIPKIVKFTGLSEADISKLKKTASLP